MTNNNYTKLTILWFTLLAINLPTIHLPTMLTYSLGNPVDMTKRVIQRAPRNSSHPRPPGSLGILSHAWRRSKRPPSMWRSLSTRSICASWCTRITARALWRSAASHQMPTYKWPCSWPTTGTPVASRWHMRLQWPVCSAKEELRQCVRAPLSHPPGLRPCRTQIQP